MPCGGCQEVLDVWPRLPSGASAVFWRSGSRPHLRRWIGARIQGRVTDQSGAIVPNAKVEAIQLGTGTSTPVSTNGEGLYTIPNLPSGEYQVVISKPGFASAIGEGVSIRAGVQIRVDLVLQPAGVTEAVAVRASALDSAAISNSTTLDEKLVKDLPVIVSGTKRDITAMLANLPGFTGAGRLRRGRTGPTWARPKCSLTAAAPLNRFSAARSPRSVQRSNRSASSASSVTASTRSTGALASGSATSPSSPEPTPSPAACSIISATIR